MSSKSEKPVADVGDIVNYILDKNFNTVSLTPLTEKFCGVYWAARKAASMKLITMRAGAFHEYFITLACEF